jgi:phosphoenolpyruvate carboxylase
MNVDTPTGLLYHTYNSLFLSLPFNEIEETGTHLALFGRHCKEGFEAGKSPVEIVEAFWNDYYKDKNDREKWGLLLYFIQYVERQIVLFDSVEDALFTQTHDSEGPGSVKHLLTRLHSESLKGKLLSKIRSFELRLVLTAHPTQFYPGKVLGIINDLGDKIRHHDLEQIRLLLKQLGKTSFMNRERPDPLDEATSLGWYLENVFFQTLPDVLFRLLKALKQDVTEFENPHLLSLGFWPGGDRDGNPYVTADTTREVGRRMKEVILRNYNRDIRLLKRRLTFRGVEEIIALTEKKIYNTLYKPDETERYQTCDDLLNNLLKARKNLLDNGGKDKKNNEDFLSEFKDELDRFILKVRVFGFHFASIDIRQDSRKHGEVWKEIIKKSNDPIDWEKADEQTKIERLLNLDVESGLHAEDFDGFTRETIGSFEAIAEIQAQNGELGCHRYIISNCQSALNVLEVFSLARLTLTQNQKVPLDVVPLFETIDDLKACGDVMRWLYTNKLYSEHLESRGRKQHIMLGFSDGTKDGGYLRANWSIYRAKEELSRVSREHGVTVVFFDGRGGPPGRGGGNNASYYAAQGQDVENQAIHLTIQGQTVSSTYGTLAAASYNIEHLLTAGLENHLFPEQVGALKESDRDLLDELAEMAYDAYLKLKNHPDFVPYLEKMTPLKRYGEANIASRPTKRGEGRELKLEDLRAIPFVGAWAQMKQNVPGYYGVGAAISEFKKKKDKELRELYRHSLFFRTLLENSMQSLSKSNFDVTRYLEKHPQFGAFWKMLFEEYKLTDRLLKEVSGQEELLSSNPTSRVSIELREEIVLPLIAIQQFGLQKLQNENLSDDERKTYEKLVLRAMFGIINAARNAA